MEAQGGESRAKYGNGFIREYSKRLTLELGKGYDSITLKRMRKLYIVIEKGAALRHQLTWSHYRELLILNDSNQINYYIKITLGQNLSYRQLRDRIKSNEYERLDEDTKLKLISNEEISLKDEIKHPIIMKNKYDTNDITEKMLKNLILEHIGQIEIYMNYIDKNVKSINHDKTIGIIIAKRDNKFVMEYCSDMRIFNTAYELV